IVNKLSLSGRTAREHRAARNGGAFHLAEEVRMRMKAFDGIKYCCLEKAVCGVPGGQTGVAPGGSPPALTVWVVDPPNTGAEKLLSPLAIADARADRHNFVVLARHFGIDPAELDLGKPDTPEA